MDSLQQKALDALEPFVILSESATSHSAAADLVQQAISAPDTFLFAELLETPNIQSLREASSEYAPYLTLLEIFSWGTWTDYINSPNLPPLSDPQSHKLRKLSLLTYCLTPSLLTYTSLLSTFSLPTIRALENLVLSATNDTLLSARLNPVAGRVEVSSVAPLRDVAPNGLRNIMACLEEWEGRSAKAVVDMDAQISAIWAGAAVRRRREIEHEAMLVKSIWKEDEGERVDRGAPGLVTGKRGAVDVPERGDEAGWGPTTDVMDMDVNQDYMARLGNSRNAKRGNKFGGAGKRLGP